VRKIDRENESTKDTHRQKVRKACSDRKTKRQKADRKDEKDKKQKEK
jgi:hypothetical protein